MDLVPAKPAEERRACLEDLIRVVRVETAQASEQRDEIHGRREAMMGEIRRRGREAEFLISEQFRTRRVTLSTLAHAADRALDEGSTESLRAILDRMVDITLMPPGMENGSAKPADSEEDSLVIDAEFVPLD